MSAHMVSYDLKVKNTDNAELRAAIEKYESIHLHESVWVVDSEQKPQDVVENLNRYLKNGDKLFVCEMERSWWSMGIFTGYADWLKSSNRTW